jgi:hypothetical protein
LGQEAPSACIFHLVPDAAVVGAIGQENEGKKSEEGKENVSGLSGLKTYFRWIESVLTTTDHTCSNIISRD